MSGSDHHQEPRHDLRQIPKWARRYAQNREILPGVLVTLLFGVLFGVLLSSVLAFIIFGPILLLHRLFSLAGYDLRGPIACVWGGGVAVLVAWLLVRHRARSREIASALGRKMGNWIFRSGGYATPLPAKTVKWSPHWLTYGMIIVVVAPVVVAPILTLGWGEWLPPQYWQPLTALLWVPLLSYGIVRPMREEPAQSRLLLLWPALYGLHAVLIMAGLPIYVTGEYPLLANYGLFVGYGVLANYGLFVGYGVLAGLVSHIYSRFALRRLRKLAAVPAALDGAEEVGE